MNARLLPSSLESLMPGCFDDSAGKLQITGLSSDSRQVEPGNLFFALTGYSRNGIEFASQAISAGAVALASNDPVVQDMDLAVPVYFDACLDQQTSSIADRFFAEPSANMDVIGITGTNGKTSCCFWLSWLLAEAGYQVGQIGTLGAGMMSSTDEQAAGSSIQSLKPTGFTTPDAIQTQKLLSECSESGADMLVMEVSSHGLDQGRVGAVRFESAIFTNLSQDHLDYHKDMDAYLDAKLLLFRRPELKRAIINLDDAVMAKVAAALGDDVECLTYSIGNTDADLCFTDIQAESAGYRLRLTGKWGSADLVIPVYGEYNLSNLLAVAAAALSKGLGFEQVTRLLQFVPAVPGRMQQVAIAQTDIDQLPAVVIDYAHTPDAVGAVLHALRSQVSGKLVAVLGCGGERDRAKRSLMASTASQLSDLQIFTSDNPRGENPKRILDDMLDGVASADLGRVSVIEDRKQAIVRALSMASAGDLVAVLGKGHEAYQEVMGERRPFSDLLVCHEALESRMNAGGEC